ncbi:MAG: hypothetical protein RQ741_05075 [Wenzhouxiangellaceae bacterium]|nr:hypothetical protein [Wenzhouxiangellaceae bacterium]
MTGVAGPDTALTQRQADLIGRQFNSAVTNTAAYGSAHRVTHRTYETLLENLVDALDKTDSLTLMLDRGSLFIEDYAVDARFNINRLIILFRQCGLESVTFARGVDEDGLEHLMRIIAGAEDFEGVERVRAELGTHGVDAIRVNHVVLRKFTEDDQVISREGLEDLTGLAEKSLAHAADTQAPTVLPTDEADIFSRIEEVFTMRDLMLQPQRMAEHWLQASGADDGRQQEAIEQIRDLRRQVERGQDADGEHLSPLAVMQAIQRIRQDMTTAMAGQEETARLLSAEGGVLSEVEQLTCQTVVSIVVDEYRAGQTSAQRLAQIIRRVLPGSREVKRLLPLLKQSLLADGMSLAGYIELVNELSAELQSDDLVQSLEQGADSIGLSVDEIVREIRRDPGEAARLVVLAAQLRGQHQEPGGGSGQDSLSAALSEYIEKVSNEMAGDAADETLDPGRRAEAAQKMQSMLVGQVRRHGIDEKLAGQVETDLARRSAKSRGDQGSDRLVELLRQSGGLDESELVSTLGQLLEREPDLATLGATVRRELAAHGYAPEKVQEIYDQTVARLKHRSRLELNPGGVLDPNATAYFLQREITSCLRYETFFSCIMLMISQVHEQESGWRTISADEIELIMPNVFELLPIHLRELDLLGTLGSKDRNIPLIILPMTRAEGASLVLERILEGLEATRFELQGAPVGIDVIGVANPFDAEQSPDRKTYIQAMRGRLANQLVLKLKSGSRPESR